MIHILLLCIGYIIYKYVNSIHNCMSVDEIRTYQKENLNLFSFFSVPLTNKFSCKNLIYSILYQSHRYSIFIEMYLIHSSHIIRVVSRNVKKKNRQNKLVYIQNIFFLINKYFMRTFLKRKLIVTQNHYLPQKSFQS